MFAHRRAEITVMQFTGQSLPVHHFVTAPWDFYLVPYCQPSCILHRQFIKCHQLLPSLGLQLNWTEIRKKLNVKKWQRSRRVKRRSWRNGYWRRKYTQLPEFKSWTKLFAFHIALIPLGKIYIQLFSLNLWLNSRVNWALYPWHGNQDK